MLIIGQFVIIRHVIKYLLFVGMRKQYSKKYIKPYCSEICQICWERKSGKYIWVSRSYRGLEFGPQRITQRIFYTEITGVPVNSRYCVIICSIYSCIWIEYGSSLVQVSGFARHPQCLSRWHFCSRSANAHAILTPKDTKLCLLYSKSNGNNYSSDGNECRRFLRTAGGVKFAGLCLLRNNE